MYNESEPVMLLIVLALMIIYYVIPAIVVAIAAHRKGLTWIGFGLFGLVFTPFIGFLAVIAIPPKIKS